MDNLPEDRPAAGTPAAEASVLCVRDIQASDAAAMLARHGLALTLVAT